MKVELIKRRGDPKMVKNVKVSYLDVSAADFADDLKMFEILPVYKSKSLKEDLYYLMGYLVSRAFIEVRTPSWLLGEVAETLTEISPIREYYVDETHRGFYVDDTKWSYALTLKIRNISENDGLFRTIGPAIDQDTFAKCGATLIYAEKGHLNSVTISNTKFCMYLIRHGFRIGRFHAIEDIKDNIPKAYKKAFTAGVNS